MGWEPRPRVLAPAEAAEAAGCWLRLRRLRRRRLRLRWLRRRRQWPRRLRRRRCQGRHDLWRR
eukprot:scaffold49013_cov53-Phaeocystis_antarctica.AAC.4